MWMTPGAFTISLEFQGILQMNSDSLMGSKSEIVRGYAKVSTMAATDDEWKNTIVRGVSDLTEQLKAKLRNP